MSSPSRYERTSPNWKWSGKTKVAEEFHDSVVYQHKSLPLVQYVGHIVVYDGCGIEFRMFIYHF